MRDEPENTGDNSLWAFIGGIAKYFKFSMYTILWEVSYANLIMLLATIPQYKPKKKPAADDGDPPEDDDKPGAGPQFDSAADLKEFFGKNV